MKTYIITVNIICIMILANYCYAYDNTFNDGNQRFYLPPDIKMQKLLSQKFTTNNSFNNISEVANTVSLVITRKVLVVNKSNYHPAPITLHQYNGTIGEFLEKTSHYFGYSYHQQDDVIVLQPSYLNSEPIKDKPDLSIDSLITNIHSNTTLGNDVNSVDDVKHAWNIKIKDKTISVTLGRWAHISGYQIVWNATTDFAIRVNTTVNGTFRHAVFEVLQSFANSGSPLQALWYKNKVIVITNMRRN